MYFGIKSIHCNTVCVGWEN